MENPSQELDTKLFYAIGENNTGKVKELLAEGANPNFHGHQGKTAVHRACMFKRLDQFDLLIQAGGRLDEVDEDHQTPLHIAAAVGCIEIVDRLIELGANVQQQGDYGSPIDRAAYFGHVPIVATLLNSGVPISTRRSTGRTLLHDAAKAGHFELVSLLLRRGAEVDAVDWYSYESTPLLDATLSGRGPTAKLLITYGANVDQTNSWGATPLRLATRVGAIDVVEVLLEAGANINLADKNGQTPRDEALNQKNLEIISLFKKPKEESRKIRNIEKQPSQIFSFKNLFKVQSREKSKLERYKEAFQVLDEKYKIEGERYLTSEELEFRSEVLCGVRTDLGFKYQPDNEDRIKRNDEAMQVLGETGLNYTSASDVVAKYKIISFGDTLKLKNLKRQQDLTDDIHWLAPEDNPLLVIFVSHRWENPGTPDPNGTQLHTLKWFIRYFIDIAIGIKEQRENRIKRIPKLNVNGVLQAAYFAGGIENFIDTFSGNEIELRQELQNRIGFFYDYISLPQSQRTNEELYEVQLAMRNFRAMVTTTPTLIIRYPDDEYTYRPWCEIEFWSASKLISGNSSPTTPVVRTDLLGKEIDIRKFSPPSNFNSHSNFSHIASAIYAWEKKESITAKEVIKNINDNYNYAFSIGEKKSSTPQLTKPYFRAHNEPNINITPPSFQFWHSVRESLFRGIENQDFGEILKTFMKVYGLRCSVDKDLISTGLWLLACHEFPADYGFRVFYARCLLRYLFEGKDLEISLFIRLPDQSVHFKFADGEESLEG